MKHKWVMVANNTPRVRNVMVEICEHCGVLVMKLAEPGLKENDVRYLVEEPYHPVGGGEICPETCEETQTKMIIDTVMKS